MSILTALFFVIYQQLCCLQDDHTFSNITIIKNWCIYIYKPKVKKCGYFHSYTIVQSKDKLWGAANSDGTWNGLIGMVLNEVSVSTALAIGCILNL